MTFTSTSLQNLRIKLICYAPFLLLLLLLLLLKIKQHKIHTIYSIQPNHFRLNLTQACSKQLKVSIWEQRT